MTLPVVFTANGPSGYNLTKSLRFRKSASAYLNRTATTPTNGQKMTLSFWVKRGALSNGTAQWFFTGGPAPGCSLFGFFTDETFYFAATDNVGQGPKTSAVFRDCSAWYHIVLVADTTLATATDRQQIYVNGVLQAVTYPAGQIAQNATINFNSANVLNIGRYGSGVNSNYLDGYLAEVNFVDGQALTPSSFGSTNSLTGVWQPAKYTGTYGTNGFYLPFTNTTSTTTLGYDFSGNSNNFTSSNISLTAGTTYDSMTDVPTLTSATTANYPVLNPLTTPLDGTITNGNLNIAYGSSGTRTGIAATMAMTTGKFYWEVTVTASSANPCNAAIGISNTTDNSSVSTGIGYYTGYTANGWGYYGADGNVYNNASGTSYGATFTTNDVIGVTFDADARTLTFYKNNTSQGVAYTGLAAGTYYPSIGDGGGGATLTMVINFGQQPFTYTPPTGFVALNTYNLPTSTIVKGNTVMDATTYTGNLIGQAITNTASFKPDLVWVKSRSAATDNKLTDSNRGATLALISNSTGAQTTDLTGVVSFNTNGFTLGTSTTYNNTGNTYVGWQWQAGQGTTSSNTNGSITSTVSVNATAGFSVVTYTGTGSNATVGHGLGVAPSMVIIKGLTGTLDWVIYQVSVGATKALFFDTSAGASSINYFNNTAPTSSVFSVGVASNTNGSSTPFVAYCWSEIAGFSKFGSYVGNGSTDGTFVYTGFRPKFIMVKCSSNGSTNWFILDTSRDTYNLAGQSLEPNLSNAEYTPASSGYPGDILSNGFKWRDNSNNANNYNGYTYIYMAFAENPFKNALAR